MEPFPESVGPPGPSRLLCVQGDGELAARLSHALAHCQITAAYGAEHAMMLIDGGTFDFYIVSTRLPDADSAALCRRIRKFDASAPLLLYYDERDGMPYPDVDDSGAQGCLPTPVDLMIVRSVIDGLLKSARAASLRAR